MKELLFSLLFLITSLSPAFATSASLTEVSRLSEVILEEFELFLQQECSDGLFLWHASKDLERVSRFLPTMATDCFYKPSSCHLEIAQEEALQKILKELQESLSTLSSLSFFYSHPKKIILENLLLTPLPKKSYKDLFILISQIKEISEQSFFESCHPRSSPYLNRAIAFFFGPLLKNPILPIQFPEKAKEMNLELHLFLYKILRPFSGQEKADHRQLLHLQNCQKNWNSIMKLLFPIF